ncbi:hypothetical protein KBB27_00425 [Patescibacteria group bacterium]|nr:hypothetical protein [Patescibacteria group bacterium]
MDSPQRRIEWISFLYLVFFVLAVLSPSLYEHGYFGLPEKVLEEITIFLFGVAGILTFTFYERHIERREAEAIRIQNDIQKTKSELLESYSYIGSINRKIELLKRLANDTSLSLVDRKRVPRELLQGVVQNALAAAGAEAALLRIMDRSNLRTEAEFQMEGTRKQVFRVSNRELRAIDDTHASHSFLLSEDQRDVLAVPSDAFAPNSKAYLLLFLPTQHIAEIDISLLKVLVNQAQMIHQTSAQAVQVAKEEKKA